MKDEMGWTYNMHFYKLQIENFIGRLVTTGTFWKDLVAAVNKVLDSRLPLKMQKFLIR